MARAKQGLETIENAVRNEEKGFILRYVSVLNYDKLSFKH